MKRLICIFAVVLLCASASAQTLRWTAMFEGDSAGSATDGYGALAYFCYPASTDVVRLLWLDANGHMVMSNDFQIGPSGGGVYAITRFSRTELAVQLIQYQGSARSGNLLRRFQKTKSGVTFRDTPLDLKENLDSIPTALLDPKGFFTHASTNFGGVIFRRYAN
jgi:hypothetical protein